MSDIVPTGNDPWGGGGGELIFAPEETQVKRIVNLENEKDKLRSQKNRFGLLSLLFGAMLASALVGMFFLNSMATTNKQSIQDEADKKVAAAIAAQEVAEAKAEELQKATDRMRSRYVHLDEYDQFADLKLKIQDEKTYLADLKQLLEQTDTNGLAGLNRDETIDYKPDDWNFSGASSLNLDTWGDEVEAKLEADLAGYKKAIDNTLAWMDTRNAKAPARRCLPTGNPFDTNYNCS